MNHWHLRYHVTLDGQRHLQRHRQLPWGGHGRGLRWLAAEGRRKPALHLQQQHHEPPPQQLRGPLRKGWPCHLALSRFLRLGGLPLQPALHLKRLLRRWRPNQVVPGHHDQRSIRLGWWRGGRHRQLLCWLLRCGEGLNLENFLAGYHLSRQDLRDGLIT